MTHYCKYHPLESAGWHCVRCHIELCDNCSPELPGESAGTPHYCPLCNGELSNMGAAHSAPPFWQNLTSFLQYPFSMLGLCLLALAFVLPLVVRDQMILIGARVVLLGLLMKYAYTALEYNAGGRIEPITPQELGQAENTDFAIKLTVLTGVLLGAVGYVYLKSTFHGSLLAAVLLLVYPAMVMAAAIDKNLASATNVEQLKAVLAGVGPSYGALVLMLLALLGAMQSFVSLFADILPSYISQGFALTAYSYELIVLMTVTGYVLFQYQEPLHFTPSYGQERVRKSRQRQGDNASAQFDILLKEGNYARAAGVLRNETTKKGATLTAHDRYHRLLWALNDEAALNQHASPYFKVLLESNRDMQALSLMRTYLSRNSSFRPEDPDVCFDLAEAFINMKEYKMAVHVLSGLHKDAPHYARLPDAYLMAARVLNEQLGLPQKALALIQYLEGRFKTHKSYPEIQAAKGRLLAIKTGS